VRKLGNRYEQITSCKRKNETAKGMREWGMGGTGGGIIRMGEGGGNRKRDEVFVLKAGVRKKKMGVSDSDACGP